MPDGDIAAAVICSVVGAAGLGYLGFYVYSVHFVGNSGVEHVEDKEVYDEEADIEVVEMEE